jgi:hypothetical protein
LPLATALAALGERASAEAMADMVNERFSKLGSRGLNVGLGVEARARVAARVGDRNGFLQYSRRCGDLYRGTANRALIAKYERLMREARRFETIAGVVVDRGAPLTGQTVSTHMIGMLSACRSSRERAKLGLDLLIARSGAEGGYLYAVEGNGPVLVAQTSIEEPPASLAEVVDSYLRREVGEIETTGAETVASTSIAPSRMTAHHTTFRELAGEGKQLRPVLIAHHNKGQFDVTGLAVLLAHADKKFSDPSDLATHLSSIWFDAGDVMSIAGWLGSPRRE